MLRNRPRTVSSSKQALMADHHSPSSQSQSQSPNNNSTTTTTTTTTRPISAFLVSPRFRAFTTKGLSETDHPITMMSPTSTLDSKQFLIFPLKTPNPKNPNPLLLIDKTQKQKQPKSTEVEPIGLVALIDKLSGEEEEDPVGESCSKPRNSKVLFGSKLRVQIPKSSFLGPNKNFPDSSSSSSPPPPPAQVFTLREMELSEDYTCVTSHGPNPRTTHIFDNCIVESYSKSSSSVFSEKSTSCSPSTNINNNNNNLMMISFLSFCHTCSKNLEQKNDIYIYRGDKAFCSEDCRNQEMLLDGVYS